MARTPVPAFGIFLTIISLGIVVFLVGGGITGAALGVPLDDETPVLDESLWQVVAEQGEASVIIVLKDNAASDLRAVQEQQEKVLDTLSAEEKNIFGITIQDKEFSLEQQYTSLPVLAGTVTEAGLEELENNPAVASVVLNGVKHIFLDSSVPLIGAPNAWQMQFNGTNITGSGETVCVIDTGVDYTQPALGGCTTEDFLAGSCSKVVGGYDYVNDDADPMDDHGHGTHVAGIVASTDSTYKGVAPAANIVALKVCNAAGSCADDDVLAGMDWCMYNATRYNIGVISISLGGGQYSASCDVEIEAAPYAASINKAVGQQISVVLATGNTGGGFSNPTAGIALPACVKNATKVTASTDGDSIAGFAFRNENFPETVSAPGVSITSPVTGGGTATFTGTSMSTPHVSGAVALLRQYWQLAYARMPTPEEAAAKFRWTGMPIFDGSTATTFSRIALLEALQPFVNFTAETQSNGTIMTLLNGTNVTNTTTTIAMASDVPLSTALVEWQYPNGTLLNHSMPVIDSEQKQFSLNLTALAVGQHAYTAYGSDALGTTGKTGVRQLQVVENSSAENSSDNSSSSDSSPLSILLTYPLNNSRFGGTVISLNAMVNASQPISTVRFVAVRAANASANVTTFASSLENVSWNASLDTLLLSEGVHRLTAVVTDSMGAENQSAPLNFTVDRTSPAISNVQANATENTSMITFALDEGANASLGYWSAGSESITVTNTSFGLMHTFVLMGLTNATTYWYNVTACDDLSNCQTAGVYNFTTLAKNVSNQTLPDNASNDSSNNNASNNNSSNNSSNDNTSDDNSADNTNDSTANNSSNSANADSGSSSAGGAGGSSGASSASSTDSTETTSETRDSLTTAAAAESEEAPRKESLPAAEPVQPSGSATKSLSLTANELTEITFDDALLPVKKLIVRSRAGKDVTITLANKDSLPDGIATIPYAYQYLEMSAGLTEDELAEATVQFAVQKSWQDDQAAAGRSVVFFIYDAETWKALSTQLLDEQSDVLLYEAEIPHFSLFAIGAEAKRGFLVGAAITSIFDGEASGGSIIVGIFFLVLMVTGILLLVMRRRAKNEEGEDEMLLRFE